MFDRFVSATAKKAAIIIAVMGCAYQALLMFLTYATLDVYGNDFVVYWDTANRPISAAYELRPRYPFPYLPTMLLWIKPLSVAPLAPAFIAWVVISALTFTWVTRKYLTSAQNLLALLSRPVLFCLLTGQVSVFLAAVMLWAFGSRSKFWGGAALGFVASVKPQLVLLAPLLIMVRRDFQMAFAACASFGSILIVTLLSFGVAPWIDWFDSLENFRAVLNVGEMLRNVASIAGQAERAGLSPFPFMVIGMILGCALIVRCSNLGPVETTAAVATASILASPYAMTYDLAAVVPFLVLTVFHNRISSAVALTGLFHPLPVLISGFQLLRRSNNQRPSRVAAVSHAGGS